MALGASIIKKVTNIVLRDLFNLRDFGDFTKEADRRAVSSDSVRRIPSDKR